MAPNKNMKHRQQTRLNFTPLPSSSPTASDLPEHIKQRAANIRYESLESPTKKRRLAAASSGYQVNFPIDNGPFNGGALPTPEPSSQVEAKHEDERPVELSNHHSSPSSGSDEEEGPIVQSGRARRRIRPLGTENHHKFNSPSGSRYDGKGDSTSRKERYQPLSTDTVIGLSSSDESDALSLRTPRTARQDRRREKNPGPKTPVTVASDEDSDPVLLKSTRRKASQSPGSPRTPQNVTQTRSSRRLRASERRRSKAKKSTRASLRQLGQPTEPQADDSSGSTDSLMDELGKSTRKSEVGLEDQDTSNEHSSDHVIRSPRRRKGLLRRKMSSPNTQIEDAGTGPTNEGILHNNEGLVSLRRAKRPTTERQKQLELLRQRREGKKVQLSSDDELEIQSQGEGSEPNRSDNEPVNLDEDVEDFVVADDDTLGGPLGLEDIPLEFTRHAHKKPIQYFRDAVEWMVHNKLNPAFPRNDPVYTIARQKLDDVVQALAGSKYSSAIWKPEFSKAMRKYPNVTRIDLPKHDGDCEACGRSGHPAKHQLIFNGKPYHRGSLEEISSDEESDEVEGSGDEDQEQPAEPQSKAFFVGRTCRANAETFHAFNHWRHQLNHFVLELLEVQGHMDPNKIVERANWSVKKRERYANQVVDALEADGRVRDLYREFKENIAAAREADNGAYSYGR